MNGDAETVVARDKVILDGIAGRVVDLHPGIGVLHAVSQGAGAAGVGADVVTTNCGARRAIDADAN